MDTAHENSHSAHEKPHRVPLFSFFAVTGAQFILMFGLFWWALPAMFGAELAQPWKVLLWTFLMGLPLSAFEYFYHRYLLHSAVLPFLGAMHRAHSTHHGLTAVKAPVTPNEPEKMVPVFNEYPIEEPHQEESMMFPSYSISIFYAIFLLMLALPLKLLFSGEPIVLSVLIAVTLQYCGYELWHAVLHLPYDKFWKPYVEGEKSNKIVRRIYSFHLMHHWKPSCNLAVVGFWGVALWDYAFRTHRRPQNLPVAGAEVNFTDISVKKPFFPVSALDNCSAWSYRTSRKIEAFMARVFLGRRA